MRLLEKLGSEKLAGRRVLLRVDLNVPRERGAVRDDFRIKRMVPTVKKLLDAHCQVIMLAHLGEPGATLGPVAKYLEQFFPLIFVHNLKSIPESVNWPTSVAVLLENLRLQPGEENNSPELAQRLASLGDFYVNEAFSASHRGHASIVSLPRFLPGYVGPAFATEVRELSQLFRPASPLMVILAGAKFKTKLPLVRRFLEIADKIFIGGALAHSFFKFLGYEIGQSLRDDVPGLEDLIRHRKIILPAEVLVRREGRLQVTTPDQVPADATIVDAGPAVAGQLAELVTEAKTILWNGPLGNYEQGFVTPTHDLAKLIAHYQARAIVGGGDTIAAIEKLNLFDKFGFVSTGGGAMLDFLAEGTLPGIKALEENEKKFPF